MPPSSPVQDQRLEASGTHTGTGRVQLRSPKTALGVGDHARVTQTAPFPWVVTGKGGVGKGEQGHDPSREPMVSDLSPDRANTL